MYDKKYPQYGEVWMCNLSSKEGSVQCGYRPVFVVSNNMNNMHSSTLNVIPITSSISKRNLPIHVKLRNYESYGLRKFSTMLVEQITTTSVVNLDMRVGMIDDTETLNEIKTAIQIQFPILVA